MILKKDASIRSKSFERNKTDLEYKGSANSTIIRIWVLITCIKLLLLPTYRSTDFEVHRNWLAITHSLPLQQWYTEARSQWTLDYPPLFAWFECGLSYIASLVDPEMLNVDNLEYASPLTIAFQRCSVIFTDLVLAFGARELLRVFCVNPWEANVFLFLTLCNVGLLVVDHVHFQYNGLLVGILLLSIARCCDSKENRVLQGAAWFAILLNLKHIYLYVVPAYVAWLLLWYRWKDQGNSFIPFKGILKLGCIVSLVLVVSFGPFATQLRNVFGRLFPFKRGLMHAYWAANVWAVYGIIDKILSFIFKRIGWLSPEQSGVAKLTGGLVGEESFVVLPTPTPLVTFILTFASMVGVFWVILCQLKRPLSTLDNRVFVRGIVLCALGSFLFGWHVHEKAILTAIVPLCILASVDEDDARIYLILSAAGHAALMPLLHLEDLVPLKILLVLGSILSSTAILTHRFPDFHLLKDYEWLYISTLPLVTIYESFEHRLIFGDNLPFLPLALTSVYCSIGIIYAWIVYYRMFFKKNLFVKFEMEQ